MLTVLYPDLFTPYYFTHNFNVFEKICEELGIEIPEIPLKKNYFDRYFYYGSVCEALNKFKAEYALTTYELCAFLYDFAPKYIGGYESYIVKELPEPSGAYLIGSRLDDPFYSDERDTIAPWQCSPDTKAGDMVLMYLTSPVSSIDSLWRSVSAGFNDPFFYYYRCTYITHPAKMKPITLKDMSADPILGKMPIVRRNMQGLNGYEFKPSQYNRILDISKIEAIRLNAVFEGDPNGLATEKDVEEKLIIPLLQKLGYSGENYRRQYCVPVGNHNRLLIPDFVIEPREERSHSTAFAIVEAKLSISNQKELETAKLQVRSYCLQLRTEYALLASREKISVFSKRDDYINCVFQADWDELHSDPDTFAVLDLLIGANRKRH